MKRLKTPLGAISARDVIDGLAIDPKLPSGFDGTPHDERPLSHFKFWGRPFIVTETVEALDTFYAERTDLHADHEREEWAACGRQQWMGAWPTGTRYEVRRLDGRCWDRSTSWGMFPTLADALACAKGAAE